MFKSTPIVHVPSINYISHISTAASFPRDLGTFGVTEWVNTAGIRVEIKFQGHYFTPQKRPSFEGSTFQNNRKVGDEGCSDEHFLLVECSRHFSQNLQQFVFVKGVKTAVTSSYISGLIWPICSGLQTVLERQTTTG